MFVVGVVFGFWHYVLSLYLFVNSFGSKELKCSSRFCLKSWSKINMKTAKQKRFYKATRCLRGSFHLHVLATDHWLPGLVTSTRQRAGLGISHSTDLWSTLLTKRNPPDATSNPCSAKRHRKAGRWRKSGGRKMSWGTSGLRLAMAASRCEWKLIYLLKIKTNTTQN